ncbi:MAG: hypothetical protein ACK4L8_02395 [Nitrincola lacisaponensis]|uniref:tetratricopeptide repeat protein n=1 Tax=Nitrincola lacisaponensis TaxID=267850 RepID=UPI003919E7D9
MTDISIQQDSNYQRILDLSFSTYDKVKSNESAKKIIELCENSLYPDIPQKIIKISDLDVNSIESYLSIGKYYLRMEDYKNAISIFSNVISKFKDNPASWGYLIKSLQRNGAKNQAQNKINDALKRTKRHPAIVNLKTPFATTNTYANSCLRTLDINQLRKLKNKKPSSNNLIDLAYYHYASAQYFHLTNDPSLALSNVLISLEVVPTEYSFWCLLARILISMDESSNAFTAALEAYTLEPNAYTLDHLLLTSNKTRNFHLVENQIKRRIEKKPKSIESINLYAKKQHLNQEYESSIQTLEHSLGINENHPETLHQLGLLYFEVKNYEKSFLYLNKLFDINEKYLSKVNTLLYCTLCACFLNEWEFIDKNLNKLLSLFDEISKLDNIAAAFFIMSLTDDFKKHAHIARLTSKTVLSKKTEHLTERFNVYPDHKKIRIGYLSGDIGNHIVSELFLRKLKYLNTEKFTPYVYSYRKNDNSENRIEVMSLSEFYDIKDMSDRDAAIMIANHEIDILVDLTVYTSSSRSNIMSYRPAPIQLHEIGFSSTSGASDIYDYMLVNQELLYSDNIEYYAESLVLYKNSEHFSLRRHTADKLLDKSSYNLPDGKFVLASFNEPFKITKHMFGLWCQVLEKNPNTVLWIFVPDEYRRKNIIREAQRNGINPNRLIFTENIPLEQHKKRLHLADLLLDTFPYGNHSSAKFSLESGTPIVAYQGKSQASRISSLHLKRAGLENLVAQTDDQFIGIASQYINDDTFRNNCLRRLEQTLNSSLDFTNADTRNTSSIYITALESIYNRFKENPSIEAKQTFEI